VIIVIKAILIEKGSGNTVKASALGTVTAQNGTWTLDAGNFRTDAGEKISSLNNYLVQVEVFDKDGKVVGRTISPDISNGQSVAIYAGVLDDPVKVASAYTQPTEREPVVSPTPTPTTAGTPIPSTTASPTPTNTTAAKAAVSNAQVVNKLDGSFTVIWETDIPTNSYITYTINGENKTSAFDKRSNERLSRSLRTHFVEVTDTTNPEGTKYDITLINNSVAWKDIITYTKIAMNETPSIDSVKLSFDTTGNFIDQIVYASVPGQSTIIAATPNTAGTTSLDLTALRKSTDPETKYPFDGSDKLTFTVLGGSLTNKTDLESKSATALRGSTTPISVKSTPKDLTPFKIIYINIRDGEVIKKLNPDFFGEGFEPSSDLQIQIEKQ
jgi:hypothetical protein